MLDFCGSFTLGGLYMLLRKSAASLMPTVTRDPSSQSTDVPHQLRHRVLFPSTLFHAGYTSLHTAPLQNQHAQLCISHSCTAASYYLPCRAEPASGPQGHARSSRCRHPPQNQQQQPHIQAIPLTPRLLSNHNQQPGLQRPCVEV